MGIVLYNLCLMIILILTYVSENFIRNIFIIIIDVVFDFYQISHYINIKVNE